MASFTILRPNEEADSSSDEEMTDDFVSYSERPEWTGVEPTPQDDGGHSVVAIQYSPMFAETFGYFRTVLKTKEVSERALNLTTDCILFNSSNYTVWNYRRILLEKLNSDYLKELAYVENTITRNQKNYQVWEHYKCINSAIKAKIDRKEIELAVDSLAGKVKSFIYKIIDNDSKNYHAWQHLQWLSNEWSQWEGELDYTQTLIGMDIRNNSAWNHRFYVLEHTTKLDAETVKKECEFLLPKIELAPRNESVWNYLTGLFRRSGLDFDVYPELIEHCNQLYEEKTSRSAHLMAFMITYNCSKMEQMKQAGEQADDKYLQYFTETIDLLTDLETSIDTLRASYWKYRTNVIRDTFSIRR